eukprot:m.191115 g.191115  ORF g.191115 m.191115 type:complete len:275 (-) comp10591_c2_seq4:1720-2544(-)
MSYNNIGLTTARGSGTNGYVQRNFANVRRNRQRQNGYNTEEDFERMERALQRGPNPEILLHERKRQIEVKCIELADDLEARGLSEEDIETKVDEYRQELLKDLEVSESRIKLAKTGSSHQQAEQREHKNQRMHDAFGIREDYVPGVAFDQEVQEQRRQQRVAEREARREEREERDRRYRKERERRDRDRDRDADPRRRSERRPSRSRPSPLLRFSLDGGGERLPCEDFVVLPSLPSGEGGLRGSAEPAVSASSWTFGGGSSSERSSRSGRSRRC